MATLVSPGVSVSIIDESISIGAGQGTVPFILLATAQDKTTPDGSSTAEGTTKATAGTLYTITSQRELLQTFGDPIFQSSGGNQINGSPLNEYGLLAAHSYLGLANRIYAIRADVDLAELEASTIEPTSPKPAGTLWLDTDDTEYGIFEWDATVLDWVAKDPAIIFDGPTDNAEGSDGDYSVSIADDGNDDLEITYYLKTAGAWGIVGAGTEDVQIQAVYPTLRADGSSALVTGDVWVKTVSGNSGADYDLSMMSGTTGQYVAQDAPVFTSDADANSYYGASLTSGLYYIGADSNVSPVFHLKLYNGTAWEIVSTFEHGASEPKDGPSDGAYWYNADVGLDGDGNSTVDLLVNDGQGSWLNMNLPGETPIAGRVTLYTQSSDPNELGATLNTGDIWVDTDQLDNYPVMYKWNATTSQWTNIDTADQTTPNGVIFADARPNPTFGTDEGNNNGGPGDSVEYVTMTAPGSSYTSATVTFSAPTSGTTATGTAVIVGGEITGITITNGGSGYDSVPTVSISGDGAGAGADAVLLAVPDMDIDVPDPDAYPAGMLLWNTRYSTRNVKVWDANHLVDEDSNGNPVYAGRWVSASGNNTDGSLKAGTDAQRGVIVTAMQAAITSNEDLRSEVIFFNIMATPGFPELIDEMISLNIDRRETGFVIGDTPFTLSNNSTDLANWSANANNATGDGEEGLVTANVNLGVYYPSGLSTNLDGQNVVVPPSHMMLRTIAYNDQVAYPWFAPAGSTRGIVTNASSVGYVDSEGEYRAVTLNQGQRDILYTNNVNPIATMAGTGIQAYGQKTRSPAASALGRINVARLVNYIRYQSDRLAERFLFEPNDSITRAIVEDTFNRFFAELVTLRGITDFIVVCDESNNTPFRIDNNELWIDAYIVPTKAIEFIYVPIRISNTGSI